MREVYERRGESVWRRKVRKGRRGESSWWWEAMERKGERRLAGVRRSLNTCLESRTSIRPEPLLSITCTVPRLAFISNHLARCASSHHPSIPFPYHLLPCFTSLLLFVCYILLFCPVSSVGMLYLLFITPLLFIFSHITVWCYLSSGYHSFALLLFLLYLLL